MSEEDISMLDDILKDDFDDKQGQKETENVTKPATDPTDDDNLAEELYAATTSVEARLPFEEQPRAASPFVKETDTASPFGKEVDMASPFGEEARVASPFGQEANLFDYSDPLPTKIQREPSPKLPTEEYLQPSTTIPAPQSKQRTRYFIIKSYSAENVTISLRRGIWATQKQNEQVFNDAFLDTPRVIMLFSINGSRHFQGYARMTSLIQPNKHHRNRDFGGDVSKWGSTFTLNWERVGSVPFAETDHLRNPLADNLPLTRARDGQEVTEKIGEELCRLIDHHSIPILPDIEFPVTEAERECLLNDPRSQGRALRSGGGGGGGGGGSGRMNRGFEPYPTRNRTNQSTSDRAGERDRDRDRNFRPRIEAPLRSRRDLGVRDMRDDRWEDADHHPLRLLPPPETDISRTVARPLQDLVYNPRPLEQETMYAQPMQPLVDVDLTQLTYEEYLALKQRQQQLAEQQQMQMRWEDPLPSTSQFLSRDVNQTMFGMSGSISGAIGGGIAASINPLPQEGYARYGNFGAF